MVFVVAESQLLQLPTIKEKVDTNTKVKGESANFSAPKEKLAPKGTLKKGENEKSAPPSNSTSYEVIGQYKGSDLVGKKWVTTCNLLSPFFCLHTRDLRMLSILFFFHHVLDQLLWIKNEGIAFNLVMLGCWENMQLQTFV